MADLFWYRAAPIRVIDGDTLIVEIDLGLRVRAEHSIRILDLDTPELFSGEDREAGARAKAALAAWVMDAADGGRWPLLIHTKKDSQTFNRYLADVYNTIGESAAEHMHSLGYASGVTR